MRQGKEFKQTLEVEPTGTWWFKKKQTQARTEELRIFLDCWNGIDGDSIYLDGESWAGRPAQACGEKA